MKRINDANINLPEYWSGQYAAEYGSGKRRIDNERFEFVLNNIRDRLQYIPANPNPSFLDAGCGTGELLILIHSVFPHISKFGVDHAQWAIDRGQQDNPGFTFVCSSIYSIPASDNNFDIVCCMETLEHLDDPAAAVKELMRLIRPGGNCILSVPFKDKNPSDEHVHEFTFEDAMNLTNAYGTVQDARILAGGVSIGWCVRKYL